MTWRCAGGVLGRNFRYTLGSPMSVPLCGFHPSRATPPVAPSAPSTTSSRDRRAQRRARERAAPLGGEDGEHATLPEASTAIAFPASMGLSASVRFTDSLLFQCQSDPQIRRKSRNEECARRLAHAPWAERRASEARDGSRTDRHPRILPWVHGLAQSRRIPPVHHMNRHRTRQTSQRPIFSAILRK